MIDITKVAGYYLYFTSFCIIECMHVPAIANKAARECYLDSLIFIAT